MCRIQERQERYKKAKIPPSSPEPGQLPVDNKSNDLLPSTVNDKSNSPTGVGNEDGHPANVEQAVTDEKTGNKSMETGEPGKDLTADSHIEENSLAEEFDDLEKKEEKAIEEIENEAAMERDLNKQQKEEEEEEKILTMSNEHDDGNMEEEVKFSEGAEDNVGYPNEDGTRANEGEIEDAKQDPIDQGDEEKEGYDQDEEENEGERDGKDEADEIIRNDFDDRSNTI